MKSGLRSEIKTRSHPAPGRRTTALTASITNLVQPPLHRQKPTVDDPPRRRIVTNSHTKWRLAVTQTAIMPTASLIRSPMSEAVDINEWHFYMSNLNKMASLAQQSRWDERARLSKSAKELPWPWGTLPHDISAYSILWAIDELGAPMRVMGIQPKRSPQWGYTPCVRRAYA